MSTEEHEVVDLERAVVEILAVVLGIEPGKISVTDSLEENLGMNSYDTVEFVMELEEEFDIVIEDQELEKLNTVKDCVDLIRRKRLWLS